MDDHKDQAIADLEMAKKLKYEENYGNEVNELLEQLS
jgi:hypothetical protein